VGDCVDGGSSDLLSILSFFHSFMIDAQTALDQLQRLCQSIQDFNKYTLPSALYRAPVIDWHHPDDYSQKAIAGLRKFLSTAEAERDHVAGVSLLPSYDEDLSC
jgi:hypothetical protein